MIKTTLSIILALKLCGAVGTAISWIFLLPAIFLYYFCEFIYKIGFKGKEWWKNVN